MEKNFFKDKRNNTDVAICINCQTRNRVIISTLTIFFFFFNKRS